MFSQRFLPMWPAKVGALCAISIAVVVAVGGPALAGDPAQPTTTEPDIALKVRDIRVVGGAMLRAADVERIVAPFRNHIVVSVDLEQIRLELTQLCIAGGYINSGAIVPTLALDDGVLVVQIVSGRISDIRVEGAENFDPSYFTARLRRATPTPFRLQDLEAEQQVLLGSPFIRRLNLDVEPGLEPGDARIDAQVTETKRWQLSAEVANDQSPSVGEVRGQLGAMIGNLLGVGDSLQGTFGHSSGLSDGSVDYAVPLTSADTMLDLHYDANANSVIEPSLKALGLTSRYNSFSVGLSQPFHLSTTQTLTLGVVGEVRRSQSLVLGMPFSFVNGAQDGRTNDTVVRLSQDWLEQDSGELLSLHSRVSVGVDAFGATVQGGPGTASGRFVSWLGQALWQRQVFPRAQIVIHGNLQISDGALFPLEQYVFGGIDSLRGYRAYLTSSDDAVNVQSELRCGLFQFAIPGIATTEGDGLVQLVPFVDWGSGWNVRQAAPAYPNLASAGSGVRWSPGSGVVAEIYYGRAFRNVHVGNSLGDQGVQFRVSLKM